jgi:hypothetical protein
MNGDESIKEIWLEVSNVALNEGEEKKEEINVQIKADLKIDRWLKAPGKVDQFKALIEAMKDKRPIHAKLEANDKKRLHVTELRVSFAPTPYRG